MERLYCDEENVSFEDIDNFLEKKQRQAEKPKRRTRMMWSYAFCFLNGAALLLNFFLFVAGPSYWNIHTEEQVRLRTDGMLAATLCSRQD